MAKSKAKLGFYQKYRPHRFRDVLGQEPIITILRNQVRRKMTHHAYLFTGPSGVGKTSVARILASALNCSQPRAGEPCLKCPICQAALRGNSWDTIEFDAAVFRGIEGIRDMSTLAHFAPHSNYKVYILDEVHQLTEPAWYALLRLLEEPAGTLTIILCTTEPSRVPETARSRCQTFDFASLNNKVIAEKLAMICRRERLKLSRTSLSLVANMAMGNLRMAEATLEQVMNLDHGSPKHKEIMKFLQSRV